MFKIFTKVIESSTVRTLVAQRLPSRVCRYCIEPFPAPAEAVKTLTESLSSIENFDIVKYLQKAIPAIKKKGERGASVLKEPEIDSNGNPVISLYRGSGCDRCGGSGYSGRIGIFEVLDVNEKISRMIMEDVTAQDIEEEARKYGMISMIQDGYLKALEGLTSIEEVLRVSKE